MNLTLSPQQKAERARKNVQALTVASLRPNLSPEQRETYRNLERSARAESQLRQKALDPSLKDAPPEVQTAASPPQSPRLGTPPETPTTT